MTRTDPSNGALNRSAGLWHTPASAASLGPAMRPTHYGEVSVGPPGFCAHHSRLLRQDSSLHATRRLRERRRDVSDGAGSPWLVLVREPDHLGIERTHAQLAFGLRLVELPEPHRHVAADDDRTPPSLDDDHLHAACVARRRDESEPGKQLVLAVDRHVPHAGGVDPLADRVVVLAARVVELATLDVDRPAGEEVVAAAVIGVQVSVDDDVDAGEIEVLLAQWPQAGIELGRERVQLGHAGVDEDARLGMVDDVHIERHRLALDVEVGNEDRRDGGRGGGVHLVSTAALSVAGRSKCLNTAPSKVTSSVTTPSCTRRTSIASGSYAASPGLPP